MDTLTHTCVHTCTVLTCLGLAYWLFFSPMYSKAWVMCIKSSPFLSLRVISTQLNPHVFRTSLFHLSKTVCCWCPCLSSRPSWCRRLGAGATWEEQMRRHVSWIVHGLGFAVQRHTCTLHCLLTHLRNIHSFIFFYFNTDASWFVTQAWS